MGLADEIKGVSDDTTQLMYAVLRIDAMAVGMSEADFERTVLERLGKIDERLTKVETEFARWGGAVSLVKVAISIIGFAGVIWLIQMAAAAH